MNTQTNLDCFLSVRQAMAVANVRSRATLWKWEQQGIFPKAHKVGARKVAYLESELRLWIEQRSAV